MPKEFHKQSQRQRRRVGFTFQSEQDSPNGEVLRWLLHKEGRSLAKDRALDAVRAFWLPLARLDAERYSHRELQDAVQLALWRLEEQIRYLRSHFGLQSTEAVSLPLEPHPKEVVLRSPKDMASSQLSLGSAVSDETLQLFDLEQYDWSINEAELGEAL